MALKRKDAALIKLLGGQSAVARLIGVKRQAVDNWYDNGIPKLRRLQIANELKRQGKPIPAALTGELAA